MSKFERIDESPWLLPLLCDHITLRAVKLVSDTDHRDTLVEETVRETFLGKAEDVFGHIFIITDRLAKESTVIVIPAPDFVMPSAKIEKKTLHVDSCGYPIYKSTCAPADAERTVRDWYREQYTPATIHAMSNTWGDRNGRTRVCDEFIRREIESGADLCLDVVQIDDGWQKGVPPVWDETRTKIFEGDFWELKRDIFPNGMAVLSDYAHAHGVELGLWFAPHSRGPFEHFDRDISVLSTAYHDWHMKYFKLDMIHLPSRERCDKMLEFLDRVISFGEGTSVELDVTTDLRLGYLAPARYGTIFVENRYTAWGNYYPHRTLRNLWMLSRFLPPAKMQFELINPDLFTDVYAPDDVYSHVHYEIDYLFASVMLSNPLFWMETQFLSERSRALLKDIIPLWKEYRESFTHADVRPIGEEPSGASLTGFAAETEKELHLILFREVTDRTSFALDLGISTEKATVIKSKSPTTLTKNGTSLTVEFSEPRSYVWVKIEK